MRNGFDERNDRSLLVGASPRPDRGVVSIFYGSGTKAHNSDFNELASSALASVLEKYRHVRLVIVGPSAIAPGIGTLQEPNYACRIHKGRGSILVPFVMLRH